MLHHASRVGQCTMHHGSRVGQCTMHHGSRACFLGSRAGRRACFLRPTVETRSIALELRCPASWCAPNLCFVIRWSCAAAAALRRLARARTARPLVSHRWSPVPLLARPAGGVDDGWTALARRPSPPATAIAPATLSSTTLSASAIASTAVASAAVAYVARDVRVPYSYDPMPFLLNFCSASSPGFSHKLWFSRGLMRRA